MALAVACGPNAPRVSDTALVPSWDLVGSPVVERPADAQAFGVRQLTLSTEVPTAATLHIDGPSGLRTVAFEGLRTDHVLDVLGLRLGASHGLSVVLEDADGLRRTVEVGTVQVERPEGLPTVEVLVHDRARMEPGLLVLAPRSTAGQPWLVVLDEDLHIVHALPQEFEDLRWHDQGWLGLRDQVAVSIDAMGRDRWTLGRARGGLNHELLVLDDGNLLTLDRAVHAVDDYPVDVDGSATERAWISSQVVQRYAPPFELVEAIDLFDLLPVEVVGYKSVQDDGVLRDWTHANSVIPYGDDAYLVSVRHLDVVACVERDGDLRWLLGDPTGWPASHQPYFLDADGPLTWPRHQHALELQPDGTVVMFDNGNFGGSPRAPAPEDHVDVSRAVAFRVDDAAHTVAQVWEVGHEGLFTYAMGDADVLPQTGLVQLVFARVAEPQLHTRLVQKPLDGGPAALDIAIGRDVPRWTYRATVIPSLYGPGAIETR